MCYDTLVNNVIDFVQHRAYKELASYFLVFSRRPDSNPEVEFVNLRTFLEDFCMRSSVVIISSLVVISLGVFAFTVKPSKTPQNAALRTVNRTDAFSVVKAELDQNGLSITLKNNSVKTITAFSISPAKGVTIIEEFLLAETPDIGVKSNQVFSKTYHVPNSFQPQSVEINALILEDGTVEGDLSAARQIEDSRLGQQIQMRRAVNELKTYISDPRADISQLEGNLVKALNASDDDTLNTILELKPSRKDAKQQFSNSLREGLDNGRQNVLRNVSEAKATRSADGLVRLKASYERILSRS